MRLLSGEGGQRIGRPGQLTRADIGDDAPNPLLLGLLTPDELTEALEQRLAALDATVAELDANLAAQDKQGLPRIALLESEVRSRGHRCTGGCIGYDGHDCWYGISAGK